MSAQDYLVANVALIKETLGYDTLTLANILECNPATFDMRYQSSDNTNSYYLPTNYELQNIAKFCGLVPLELFSHPQIFEQKLSHIFHRNSSAAVYQERR